MEPVTKSVVVLVTGVLTLALGCILGWYGFPTIIDNMIEKVSDSSGARLFGVAWIEGRDIEFASTSYISRSLFNSENSRCVEC